MDKELLEAISKMMDEKLEPIKKDIAELKDDVSTLKETSEVTRDGVNSLLEWAEECGNVIKFPLPKVK
jgi:hypothetical protein